MTDLAGAYRFDFIAAGDYTVSEREQPAGTIDGLETSGGDSSNSDVFDVSVSGMSTSEGNNFAERGLAPRFAFVDALASTRGDGLLVVLGADGQQQWVEDRGGWDGISTVAVTLDGALLSIVATDTAGVESVRNLTVNSDRVHVLSRTPGGETMLRVNGSSATILTPSAVDAFFAV
jgi:hypothetical protein